MLDPRRRTVAPTRKPTAARDTGAVATEGSDMIEVQNLSKRCGFSLGTGQRLGVASALLGNPKTVVRPGVLHVDGLTPEQVGTPQSPQV